MSDIQLRAEIGKFLAIADERLLASVYAMMKSYLEHDQDIVGFTTDGKPLTKKELLELVETSRKEGLQGKVIGADALLAELKI
ncbi:MAG TPA: hypothetical protein PK228_22225 [Saprospiraceae bacterium]|nr:hypothetical protein [Saprospiraceae bacterium]